MSPTNPPRTHPLPHLRTSPYHAAPVPEVAPPMLTPQSPAPPGPPRPRGHRSLVFTAQTQAFRGAVCAPVAGVAGDNGRPVAPSRVVSTSPSREEAGGLSPRALRGSGAGGVLYCPRSRPGFQDGYHLEPDWLTGFAPYLQKSILGLRVACPASLTWGPWAAGLDSDTEPQLTSLPRWPRFCWVGSSAPEGGREQRETLTPTVSAETAPDKLNQCHGPWEALG